MLKNIKSDYFLKNIFNLLDTKKYLSIILHNKNLQSRLNITINNYKTFFNQIEIELKPTEVLKEKENIFLNRLDNKKEFYHIYFNNNKTEIKRRFITEDDKVSKIKIVIDEEISSLKELFFSCDCIKEINFIKFNRKNITNMISMFEECSSLVKLNINKIKTDNVNNIKSMFRGCTSLKEIDLYNFNTSKIEFMQNLFYDCSSLENLNISNFDTSKVKNMSYMFFGCGSLKKINMNNFNTTNVKEMTAMFYGCSSLKEIDVSKFNTKNISNMSFMFYGCSSLINIDISHFIINESYCMIDSMFSRCSEELRNLIKKQNIYLKDDAFREYL